jgi:predicted homoserine dehydrogenase-like protein
MHGPQIEVDDLHRVFIPRSDGGLLSAPGRVDFSTGRVSPGVFAVVHTDDPRMRKDMKFITKAEGPYYLHFRPYHLCDIETPQSIAEAVLFGERTLVSEFLAAEVVAVAKRDLRAGEAVGDYGGFDFFGTIDTYENARAAGAIPLGLAPHGRMLRDVLQGELLTRDTFQPDTSTFVYRLRMEQDALDGPAGLEPAGAPSMRASTSLST